MKSKIGYKKTESFKENKRLRVFLLFLAMSFLFWILIKLSKSYISDVEFRLNYTEVPQNKLLQNTPKETIVLTLKSMGFKMLGYKLRERTLNYSLNDIKRIKGSRYYSLSKTKINLLQAQLSAETTVLKIKPDTIYFDLGIKKSKKVKIIPLINLEFKPGFNLTKEQIINPKFVTVSGPNKTIDTIDKIHTEIVKLENLSEPFKERVKLVNPSKLISLSVTEITVEGRVEKITEGSFILPYKVINLPKKYIISTYPKEVKVVYQVALNDYNKISKNSFKIQCDFKQAEENNLDYLIPVIVEKPEILFDVKAVPNKIEFLIKK